MPYLVMDVEMFNENFDYLVVTGKKIKIFEFVRN